MEEIRDANPGGRRSRAAAIAGQRDLRCETIAVAQKRNPPVPDREGGAPAPPQSFENEICVGERLRLRRSATLPVPDREGGAPAPPQSFENEIFVGERFQLRRSATLPAPPYFPIRKHPSRHSVLNDGFRSVILFVTVVVNGRRPLLASPQMMERMLANWAEATKWVVGRFVIMPDHVHFFCAPNSTDCSFQRWLTFWKSRFSKGLEKGDGRPFFQADCWDTQMRTGRQYQEKWEYVRGNPVRKGLVQTADDWPYQGCVNDLVWHD